MSFLKGLFGFGKKSKDEKKEEKKSKDKKPMDGLSDQERIVQKGNFQVEEEDFPSYDGFGLHQMKREQDKRKEEIVEDEVNIQEWKEVRAGKREENSKGVTGKYGRQMTSEEVESSAIESFIELLFESERFREILDNEDVMTLPARELESEYPNIIGTLLQFQDSFLQGKYGQLAVKLHAFIKGQLAKSRGSYHDIPRTMVQFILAAVRILRHEQVEMENDSIKLALLQLFEGNPDEIEGTYLEPIIREDIFNDFCVSLGYTSEEDQDSMALGPLLAGLKEFLESYGKPLEIDSFPSLIVSAQKYFFDYCLEGLDILEPFQGVLRLFSKKILQRIERGDLSMCSSEDFHSERMSLSYFKCFNSTTFSILSLAQIGIPRSIEEVCTVYASNRPIHAVLVNYLVSLYTDETQERLRSAVLLPTLQRCVDRVAEYFGLDNLKKDFDYFMLYEKNERICYCSSTESKFFREMESSFSNLSLHFVDPEYCEKPDTIKVVIKHTNRMCERSRNVPQTMLFFISSKGTVQDITDAICKVYFTKNNVQPNWKNDVESHLKFAGMSTQLLGVKATVYPTSTKIKDLLSLLRDKDPKYKVNSAGMVDLVGHLDVDQFCHGRDADVKMDIDLIRHTVTVKPNLTEIIDYVLNESVSADLTPETAVHLLPTYLYVDVSKIANLLEINIDLKFDLLRQIVQENCLDLNTDYRLIGIVTRSKHGEIQTVLSTKDEKRIFSYWNSDKQERVSKDMTQFDPNQLIAFYLQRKELDA
jgi:hypothetical protein